MSDAYLLSIVDEALSSFCIDKDKFYSLLEKKYCTKRINIGKKVEEFHEALKEVLGNEHFALEHQLITSLLRRIVDESIKKFEELEPLAVIGETTAMVGHDLRNPLQIITSEVYIAKDELKKFPESQIRTNMQECLTTIYSQVSYMTKITSDLQTLVKPIHLDAKTIKLKPLVLMTLTQIDIPENVKADIEINESQTVYADPELLKRALINLASNAIEAMPKGGELKLIARSHLDKDICLIVEDTGTGISEAKKLEIFKTPFTTKTKGQGLGLIICKKIIEAHGGDISFDSQEGKSTKFIINLPLKPQ